MHSLGLKIEFWFGEFQDWIEVKLWLRSKSLFLKAEHKILYSYLIQSSTSSKPLKRYGRSLRSFQNTVKSNWPHSTPSGATFLPGSIWHLLPHCLRLSVVQPGGAGRAFKAPIHWTLITVLKHKKDIKLGKKHVRSCSCTPTLPLPNIHTPIANHSVLAAGLTSQEKPSLLHTEAEVGLVARALD